ncbi:MAG TPA: class I SAM-dependent methyltransferase [Dehalococcoidia bacterium]
MKEENYFDARIAASYDAASSEMFEPAVLGPTVEFLAGLAGDGAALEFAIGTGRVALPLSARGVSVHGIELSPDMAAQLRAKPGADAIAVTMGDMATARVDAAFRVVYLVFNGIGNLVTQEAQVSCFQNAAAHLEPGGCFVVENGVPALRRLPPGERFQVFDALPPHIGIDEIDVASPRGISHHYWIQGGRAQAASFPWRLAWPAELDLMARIAGMTLRERWADWNREPFTSESTKHISVWQKPG